MTKCGNYCTYIDMSKQCTTVQINTYNPEPSVQSSRCEAETEMVDLTGVFTAQHAAF